MCEHIKRGDIYCIDLGYKHGCVQGGRRPVLVVSNDTNNRFSNIINVIPFTSKEKTNLPMHVVVNGYGLAKQSIVMPEQICTFNKYDVDPYDYVGHIDRDTETMRRIDAAIKLQLSS